MARVEIDGIVVDLISSAEMAGYMERALNDSDVISACADEYEFQYMGHLLQAYAVATGNLSDESIKHIADNFAKNKDKIQLPFDRNTHFEGIQRYFADHMTDDVIAYHAQKLKIPTGEIDKNKKKILSSIYMQCHNNRFMTHSFSGKLADTIKVEGLNIESELFQNEFKALELAGMRQAYKKGVLCYCELSMATFGYAQGCPERLTQAIGSGAKKNETYKEMLERNLHANLDNNIDLTAKDRQIVRYAGKKIIDFYCIEPKAAIAFMRADELFNGERKLYADLPDLGRETREAFNKDKFYVNLFLQRKGDEKLQAKYGEAIAELDAGKEFGEKQAEFVAEFKQKYLDSGYFEDFYKNADTTFITRRCLSHFVQNGNADGYTTQYIEPSKLAVAIFDAPHDLFAKREKEAEKVVEQTTEKLIAEIYQKGLYERKYMIDLKRGAKPEESFEQFQAKNPHNPHSADFAAFRINDGYNNKDSENYKKVREQAEKMLSELQQQSTVDRKNIGFSSGYTM